MNIYMGRGQHVADVFQKDMALVDFSVRGMRLQADGGRLALAEQPRDSEWWKYEKVVELVDSGDLEFVGADQCRWGLHNDKTMLPIKKPTKFLVTAGSALVGELAKQCDGNHLHDGGMGKSIVDSKAG
eukprot:3940028-Heterocapsa_arctica.AAC.1